MQKEKVVPLFIIESTFISFDGPIFSINSYAMDIPVI